FLRSEFQCDASIRSELLSLHTQHALIPIRRRGDIAAIQDNMIHSVDGESHVLSRLWDGSSERNPSGDGGLAALNPPYARSPSMVRASSGRAGRAPWRASFSAASATSSALLLARRSRVTRMLSSSPVRTPSALRASAHSIT